MSSLWLYIHFPQLQLNALKEASPEEYLAQAVVVVEGKKNTIVQLNEQATEQNLQAGMGLATAASMCRGLQIHEYDQACETQHLEGLARQLYQVNADIVLVPPKGLLLHVTPMLQLYGSLDDYWRVISESLNQSGWCYHFASAYSPAAAKAFALSALNQIHWSEAERQAAFTLIPLSHTELSVSQQRQCERIGIRTLAELLSIPASELASRFTRDVVHYLEYVSSSATPPLDFFRPKECFKRRLELLFEIDDAEALLKPLRHLLEELEAFLNLRDCWANQLSLVLLDREQGEQRLTVRSAEGVSQAESWESLFRLRFETVVIEAPVQALLLRLESMIQKSSISQDLFSKRQSSLSQASLVSVLQARLGESAVQRMTLGDDARPNKASGFSNHFSADEKAISEPCVDRQRDVIRPSILFPQPVILKERVSIFQGPERIATGWWDEAPLVRDYFVARSRQGVWLWVFKTPQQSWFLHGLFC